MTNQLEALKMAMYELKIVGLKDGDTYNSCKEALAEGQEPDYKTLAIQLQQQRKWQSLSDDEIEKIQLANGGFYKSVSFARAIEQALKEKNNA